MIDSTQQFPPTRIARFAGAMYLLQMAAGVFAQIYARGSLVVRNDPQQTAQNIIESELVFRIGIASDIICYTAVLLATWALYVLLRPIDRNLALLGLFFRFIELAIHLSATVGSLVALRLLGGGESLESIDAGQLNSLAQLAIGAQGSAVNTGFIFLGLGSAVFAYLLFKSEYIPSALARLGVFASLLLAAYALSIVVFPEATTLRLIPMLPMGIYEVTLGFWLLLGGAKTKLISAGAA